MLHIAKCGCDKYNVPEIIMDIFLLSYTNFTAPTSL